MSSRETNARQIAAEAMARLERWRGGGARLAPADSVALRAEEAAALIDHTQLKPDAGAESIRRLCSEAKLYGFASVCVHSGWVPLCKEQLDGAPVKVGSVTGFALGANLTDVKRYEAEQAISAGAEEIDMVIAIGRLKDGDYAYVLDDIATVVEAAHAQAVKVKTIIETCLLTDVEKAVACALAKAAGADFVKTSTGFNGAGATAEDVALMRAIVGPDIGVKAAGGVRTLDDLRRMVAAGATRIGASAGVQIMQDLAGESATSAPKSGASGEKAGEAY
ncbi:MAG: deoxyribose-phosphate aldolase [Chloroflexota bacterium]|nr:deoxyribose-phosphate aldolase [Chloroflexota bacterium]